MSRPGKGNKAPIFSARPSTGRPPLPGPGRLQVSLPPQPPTPPTSRFSAQLCKRPPPAQRRERAPAGIAGEGGGGPGTPAGARRCLPRSPARPLGPPGPPPRPPREPRRRVLGAAARPGDKTPERAARLARPLPAGLSVSRLASHNKSLARS